MTSIDPAAPRTLDAAAVAARVTWGILPGPEVDEDTGDLLDRGLGGVVLFGRNLRNPEQIRELTAALRRRAPRPIHVSLDQEGGHVVRIGSPLTRFPSAMAIGATRSEVLAFAAAKASGEELAALGIDVVLAPVLDLAVDPRNPTVGARSFGSSPELVARLGAATLLGYRAAGITAVPKHFPGHGRTPLDSHVAAPRVPGGRQALEASDLVPFRAAIAAGARIVMISHVAYDGVTEGLPSTLSPALLRELLRRDLAFDGIALTDAMVMDAVVAGRSPAEACVASIAAGADLIMPLEPQHSVLAAVQRAIEDGEIGEDQLVATIHRLDRLAALSTADAERHVGELETEDASRPGSHHEVARAIARSAVTLVRGRRLLPLRPDTSVLLVELPSLRRSPIEDEHAGCAIASLFRSRLPRTHHVLLRGGAAALPADLGSAAASAEIIVLATRDAHLDTCAADLVLRLRASGRPVMLAALRSPYDCAALPRTEVAVATYADVPVSVEALLDAITGAAGFPGRLPVQLDEPAA